MTDNKCGINQSINDWIMATGVWLVGQEMRDIEAERVERNDGWRREPFLKEGFLFFYLVRLLYGLTSVFRFASYSVLFCCFFSLPT
jgi:hypothetical protein